MRRFIAVFISLAFLAGLATTTAGAQDRDREVPEIERPETIVHPKVRGELKKGPRSTILTFDTSEEAQKYADSHNNAQWLFGQQVVELGFTEKKLSRVDAVAIDLNESVRVSSEDPNFDDPIPTAFHWPNQYDQHHDVDLMYSRGYDGTDQIVVVADTGVQRTHSEFTKNTSQDRIASIRGCIPGFGETPLCPNGNWWDWTSPTAGDPCTFDSSCNHGTPVAGLVVGKTKGVAQDAKVAPVRIVHEGPNGDARASMDSIIATINQSVNWKKAGHNIVAVNFSFGTDSEIDTQCRHSGVDLAMRNAMNAGILVVTSAGNSYNGKIGVEDFLGCHPNVLAVSGSNGAGYACNSKAGTGTAVVAQFNFLESADPVSGGIGSYNGTSMSSPIIAGLIALITDEHGPNTPAGALRNALINNPKHIITDDRDTACSSPYNVSTAPDRPMPSVTDASDDVNIIVPTGAETQYQAFTVPKRIIDTRYSIGVTGGVVRSTSGAAYEYNEVALGSIAGFEVDSGTTHEVKALVGTVTVYNPAGSGSTTTQMWMGDRSIFSSTGSFHQVPNKAPGGDVFIQPLTTLLNVRDVDPNDGRMGYDSVFRFVGSRVHYWVDIYGWIPEGSDYLPLTNCREKDSRPNGHWNNNNIVTDVSDGDGCADAIPSNAIAWLNVTSLNSEGGWFKIWQTGASEPSVSYLNLNNQELKSNSALARVDANGKLTYKHTGTSGEKYDILVDVVGYFPQGGNTLDLLNPSRLYDSRYNVDADGVPAGAIPNGANRHVVDGLSTNAGAGIFAMTHIENGGGSNSSWQKWNDDGVFNPTSVLNPQRGDTANNVVVSGHDDSDQRIESYNSSTATIHEIVDRVGFFKG